MKDEHKTKAQLIKELNELRLKLEDLGKSEAKYKQTAERLQEGRELYDYLFERCQTINIFIGMNGIISNANMYAAELFGYERKNLIGRDPLEFVVPTQKERTREELMKSLKGISTPPFEVDIIGEKGVKTLLFAEGHGTLYKKGKMVGVLFSAIDITERKRAEEERLKLEARIQQAQKLESLSTMAGGIAHDFNNLLQIIIGNAGMALMESTSDSPVRESLEQIVNSAKRAAELTKQMLAYSGKGRFAVKEINLSRFIEETTQIIEASVSKKTAIEYNLAGDLPAIEVDDRQIQQVIMNLVINASEAIGDKEGVIKITTGVMKCDSEYLAEASPDEDLPEGEYAYLEVSDTGCGMDDDTAAKIFDPFFTTKFAGRGLGLAAVFGIARGHKGLIKVTSESRQGSSFRILFPALEKTLPEKIVAEKSTKLWRGSGTILLIDDEEMVLDVAKKILRMMGFSVLTAGDGQEGIDIFREHADEICLVITDLTMPRMNGIETFREIRRIKNDAKVILSSGYDEQTALDHLIGLKFAGFIHKPYDFNELRETIRLILEG